MIFILLGVASVAIGWLLVSLDVARRNKAAVSARKAKRGKRLAADEVSWEPTLTGGVGASLFLIGLVWLVICGIIVPWWSWESYLEHRAFYEGASKQYASAIQMYQDRAVLEVQPSTITFNELRYEGYQQNVAGMVNDLRNQVVEYNEAIVKKRRRDANPFFSWMIIAPDPDMRLIELRILGD